MPSIARGIGAHGVHAPIGGAKLHPGPHDMIETELWGVERYRPAEQVALSEVHPQRFQLLELRVGFHAFGSDRHAQTACEGHDRRYDRRTLVTLREIANERLVDLDLVERERRQAAQR